MVKNIKACFEKNKMLKFLVNREFLQLHIYWFVYYGFSL